MIEWSLIFTIDHPYLDNLFLSKQYNFLCLSINKYEYVHKFELSAIRGELLEREIEGKREIERERDWERDYHRYAHHREVKQAN